MKKLRLALLLVLVGLLLAPAARAQTTANPKLAALALNLPGTAPAPAIRYGNAMADTLAWLLAKLQRHDYQGLGNRTGHTWLGADKMQLLELEDGPELRLQFTVADRRGKAALREAKSAFQRLVTNGPFKLASVSIHSMNLEENGHPAFEWYTPTDVSERGYLILTLNAFMQPDFGLADEAAYQGKFPGTVAATDAPQVWELRGRGVGPDSYQRYNGVFQNGVLVRGSKTFHGYGAFLDGVWLSNHWTDPGVKGPSTGDVEFRPAGTTDVVYGVFTEDEMQEFRPDIRYSTNGPDKDAGGFRSDAPVWVRITCRAHSQQRYLAREAASAEKARLARVAQEAYDAAHPAEVAARIAAARAAEEKTAARRAYARPNDPAPSYQPTLHEVTCGVCDGSGWVSGRNYGTRDQCSSCGGRGKSMSRY